ncbi:MAG: hypothetical protein ACOC2W_03120 [bacterium]
MLKEWLKNWIEEVIDDFEKADNNEINYDEFYRNWYENYKDYNQQKGNEKYYDYREFIEELGLFLENNKTVKEGIKKAKEIFNETSSTSPANLVFSLKNDGSLKWSLKWYKGEPVVVSFGYQLSKDRLPEYELQEISKEGYWDNHLEYNFDEIYYDGVEINENKISKITGEIINKLKEVK